MQSTFRTTGSVHTAQDANKQGTANGLRVLAASMMGWCLLGVPLIAFVPGERQDKLLAISGVVMVFALYATDFWDAGREAGFVIESTLRRHYAIIFAATLITVGTGILSAFTGLYAVGLLALATAAPRRSTLYIYAAAAISYGIPAVLACLGTIKTTGLLDPSDRPLHAKILGVLWVELVLATAVGIGIALNERASALLAQLADAVRMATQREALLREVRADLDRAAAIGGGGQFTGHEFGSFRLGDVLGRGGMGEVYEAVHTATGSDAAVKMLRRESFSDPGVVRRFEREARIVENLRSSHIVKVLEVGGTNAPLPYIAMERLRGTDLATQLRNQGTMPIRDVARLVRQVAAGLSVAHAAGVVHRDLKPSNLFLETEGDRGIWKILDFGVSKQLGGEDAMLTHNHIVGTPQYMAPEHASGDPNLDARADVHALAAVAYRALTGRTAFGRNPEVAQVILAVTTEIPDDPRSIANVGDDVADVLRIGFAKKPADRFATIEEFARAFADAADGHLGPELRERAKKLLEAEPWGYKRA